MIDDDPITRHLIEHVVRREGFEVVTAGDGEEGLRLAREIKPSLITLDVMMPRMDGWAVLTALKAEPALKGTPVIMMSMVDDRNMGFALGASDYLIKPVQREQLVRVLRQYSCAEFAVSGAGDRRRRRAAATGGKSLAREGWRAMEARNGIEGLARMREAKPDLVLLDLMMPEMDGFEFAFEMRRNPEWCNVPIVVLTSMDITAEERARLNGNVESVMQKGAYTRDELLEEVRHAVRQCLPA